MSLFLRSWNVLFCGSGVTDRLSWSHRVYHPCTCFGSSSGASPVWWPYHDLCANLPYPF